ncbi:hypothetical protein [Butyrivibrio fibrisolvens]|uniref:hypothetical protein n=1 Tax=Butyrivibrio fibrisolvens TaxID=831 RepID=UPI0004883F87|nr:hypothetical protein [Butyrivibrio fibrisolvens]
MRNIIKRFITFLSVVCMLLGCVGCSKNNTTSLDEADTGSFKSMTTTYPGKYKVTFMSPSTGHPDGNSDFSTYVDWKSVV